MSYRAIEGVDDIKNNTQKYADEISVAFKLSRISITDLTNEFCKSFPIKS